VHEPRRFGSPRTSHALTYGIAIREDSFHGTTIKTKANKPTQKIRTRDIAELVSFATARSGSADSAAAIVTITAPK
jgi:hypothetical protein